MIDKTIKPYFLRCGKLPEIIKTNRRTLIFQMLFPVIMEQFVGIGYISCFHKVSLFHFRNQSFSVMLKWDFDKSISKIRNAYR